MRTIVTLVAVVALVFAHRALAQDSLLAPRDTTLVPRGDSLAAPFVGPDATPDTIVVPPDSLLADSLLADSLLADSVIVDTMRALVPAAPEPVSFTLERDELLRADYRGFEDWLDLAPFAYHRSQGFVGLPDEIAAYGAGFGELTVVGEGAARQDPYLQSFDPITRTTDDVAAIEIVPSPRGFLYGATNNNAAIVLHETQFVSKPPSTRVRYYEGPDDEGWISARLNGMLADRWNLEVGIHNRSVEDRYTNTAFGVWNGEARLKYFATPGLNLFASANYSALDRRLSGGVDVSYADATIGDASADSVLYDPFAAPVNDSDRVEFNTLQRFRVGAIFAAIPGNVTEATAYYRNNYNRFRDNETDSLDSPSRVVANRRYEIAGATARMRQKVGPFAIDATGTAERVFRIVNGERSDEEARLAVGGSAELDPFGGAIVPTGFLKVAQYGGKTFYGFGADAALRPFEGATLYVGASQFDRADLLFDDAPKTAVRNAEAGVRYERGNYLVDARVFYRNDRETSLERYLELTTIDGNGSLTRVASLEEDRYGAGVAFRGLLFGVVELHANASAYEWKIEGYDERALPPFSLKAGVFYRDTLFDAALDLRTGFTLSYAASQSAFAYDRYNRRVYYRPWEGNTPSYVSTSFTLAGEIQRAAIVYFTWENLLDAGYYVTPHYPEPSRGVRFGVDWLLFD
ncbi:MAG: hypothetical protein GF419_10965 [Ignavibacteriales bacterium]|nr:hypothetical protein [Ignavibacteriales bacterium]